MKYCFNIISDLNFINHRQSYLYSICNKSFLDFIWKLEKVKKWNLDVSLFTKYCWQLITSIITWVQLINVSHLTDLMNTITNYCSQQQQPRVKHQTNQYNFSNSNFVNNCKLILNIFVFSYERYLLACNRKMWNADFCSSSPLVSIVVCLGLIDVSSLSTVTSVT